MNWRPATLGAVCLAITAAPALAATGDSSPEAVQKQFETMQQTMSKMHATKDAGELNALMQQHMTEMMTGMQMMHGMMGGQSGSMMGGQSGSMMGGQSGSMMGRGQSGGMMGGQAGGGSISQGQQTDTMANMQQRMALMWAMMNQMVQHMQEQQRLDQPKQ
jgi:hypothetical protein